MASAAHSIACDVDETLIAQVPVRIGSIDTSISVGLAHIAIDASADHFVASCSDQGGMALALRLGAAIAMEPGAHRSQAVYVIKSEAGATKIGWTNNPALRLQNLQIGSPAPLKFAGIFWLVEGDAVRLERLAHTVATKAGAMLRGEWTRYTSEAACRIIAEIAITKGIRIASSLQWVKNRQAMQVARRQVRATAYDDSISSVGPTRRDCRTWTA